MPTYDYRCDVCASQQEIAREIGDESVPTCCQTSMTRVWSAIPAIFKTSGFYKTGG